MARLPVRSNSCITCKRRKVKCDEAKPSCERCRKAYMNCEGYKKANPLIWVNENSRFKHCQEADPPLDDSLSNDGTSLVIANFYPTDFTKIIKTTSPAMDISVKSEDMWICYLSTEFLSGTNYSNIQKSTNKSWILDLLEWDCEMVAYYTVCSLSSAFWARMHNATETISKVSGKYYTKALRQLHNNISTDSTRFHPTNVASAFLLGIYELTMFEHGGGWLQHAGGVGSLIFLRGPEAHMTDPARFYYQISRLPIISQSLILRKRTFFEDPKWQTISSTIESPTKRSMYLLTDIMAKIPGLLEENDAFRKSIPGCPSPFCRRLKSSVDMKSGAEMALGLVSVKNNDKESQGYRLYADIGEKMADTRQKTVLVLSELFEWRVQFHKLHPQLAYEVTVDPKTSQTLTDDGVPLFDKLIRYREYHKGRELVLYNTSLLMIFYLIEYLSIENGVAQALDMLSTSAKFTISSLETHLTCLHLPHQSIKSSDVSTELVRSIEYFLQGTHRMNGAMNMIFPFRILMDTLESGSDERNFVYKVMDRMGVGQGFGFIQRIQAHMRSKGDLKLCSCNV